VPCVDRYKVFGMAASALCEAACHCETVTQAEQLRVVGFVCRVPLFSAVVMKLKFEDANCVDDAADPSLTATAVDVAAAGAGISPSDVAAAGTVAEMNTVIDAVANASVVVSESKRIKVGGTESAVAASSAAATTTTTTTTRLLATTAAINADDNSAPERQGAEHLFTPLDLDAACGSAKRIHFAEQLDGTTAAVGSITRQVPKRKMSEQARTLPRSEPKKTVHIEYEVVIQDADLREDNDVRDVCALFYSAPQMMDEILVKIWGNPVPDAGSNPGSAGGGAPGGEGGSDATAVSGGGVVPSNTTVRKATVWNAGPEDALNRMLCLEVASRLNVDTVDRVLSTVRRSTRPRCLRGG